MTNPNFANELIQIWARKKYAKQHKEGDVYTLTVDYHRSYSGCDTCGDSTVASIDVSKRSKKGYYSDVDQMENVEFTSLLNEMLFPLEGIKEQEG